MYTILLDRCGNPRTGNISLTDFVSVSDGSPNSIGGHVIIPNEKVAYVTYFTSCLQSLNHLIPSYYCANWMFA